MPKRSRKAARVTRPLTNSSATGCAVVIRAGTLLHNAPWPCRNRYGKSLRFGGAAVTSPTGYSKVYAWPSRSNTTLSSMAMYFAVSLP